MSDVPLCGSSLPFTLVLVWDCFSEDIWVIYPKYAVLCDGIRGLRNICAFPVSLRRFVTQETRYPTKYKAS